MNKKTYEAPQLSVHGGIAELTQGGNSGTHFDRAYTGSFSGGTSLEGFLS